MPETINKSSADMITQVDEAGFIVPADTPDPDTTIDVAVSAGDTALSVAAEGAAADGDILIIGSGDTQEIGVVASATAGSITLDLAVKYDHPVGDQVIEAKKVDAGHVEESGVDFNVSEDIFEAGAATSAKTLVRKTVSITQAITWPSIEWNDTLFAYAFGIPQSELDGTGAPDTPHRAALVSDDIKAALNVSVYVVCTTEAGDIVEWQGWNLTPDLNKSWNVSRNSVASLTQGGDVKTIVQLKHTPV